MTTAATSWSSQARAFIGSAKVLIRHLRPENSRKRSGCRGLDLKRVEHLVGSFSLDECRPFEQANRIAVLLSDTILQRILARNLLNIKELQNVTLPAIYLDDDTSLTYLYGRHRLAAAEQYLAPDDQWWGVNLYRSHDLPANARRDMREHHDNSQNEGDGEIFWKICYYQDQGDEEQADRWLAKWSINPGKVRDFRQLQNSEAARGLKSALDENRRYPGLWGRGFKMGPFHRILTMKCHDELEHYLLHDADIWCTIAGEYAQHVDAHTVECLQGRSPFYSTSDRQFILDSFESGELFSSISDPRVRMQLQERVCSVECVIPSLYCFIENTKILEPASKVLRQLLPQKFRGTIRDELYKHYVKRYVQAEDGRLWIQRDEDRYYVKQSPSRQFGFWSAYRDIWLFVLRHSPDMTAVGPRISKIPPIKHGARNTAECWSRLALHATRIGFTSKEIRRLLQDDTDNAVAKDTLAYARPGETYGADRRDRENGIQAVKAAIHVFEPHTVDERFAYLTHDGAESWRLKTRCGRTFDQAFYNDRYLYFLKQMYERRRRVTPKNNITSFAVARDIFHAFFGVGDTSGAVEDAMIADGHSVSPSEASQSEVQLDDTRQASPRLVSLSPTESSQLEAQLDGARQASPMLISLSPTESSQLEAQLDGARQGSPMLISPSPTESSQFEAQLDDTRQASPMLISLSPTESSQFEAQLYDTRQASPTLISLFPTQSPHLEAQIYTHQSLPRLVTEGENTSCESHRLQTGDDATSWEEDGLMLAPSPEDSLKWHNDAILVEDRQSGLLLDFGDPIGSELADVLVPTRRNSGATIFPGQESSGRAFPTLPAIGAASGKLAITTAFPETVVAASASFMVEAAPGPPHSATPLGFEFSSNGHDDSEPRTSGVFPRTVFPAAKIREAAFSRTAIEPDTTMAVVDDMAQLPPAPPRHTIFPGMPLLGTSFQTPTAAPRLASNPPRSIPSLLLIEDRPSAFKNQVAISPGTLRSCERPRDGEEDRVSEGVFNIGQSQYTMAPENVIASVKPSVHAALDVDQQMADAPFSTSADVTEALAAQARVTIFPGPSLTLPSYPVYMDPASPDNGLPLHAFSKSSTTTVPSNSQVSSSPHRFPVLQMSHREAEKGKEPTKKVQKRAHGPHSVAEKIAMFESKPPAFRSTIVSRDLRLNVAKIAKVPRPIPKAGNATSSPIDTTPKFPLDSHATKRVPVNSSNGDVSPRLEIPQRYAIEILENGSQKARVLARSPPLVDMQRKDRRDLAQKKRPNRKAILSHSDSSALRNQDDARQTMFPDEFALPSSPYFQPLLKPDHVLDKIQASFERQAHALNESATSTTLQRVVAAKESDDLVHIPSKTTHMLRTHELSSKIAKTFWNSDSRSPVLPAAAAEDLDDVDQHFQDELRLLEAEAEEGEKSEAEDMKTLREHFDFQSSVDEERFVAVKYHVPVGILLKFYEGYQEVLGAHRNIASLVIILGDHSFDCKFYSKTEAGRSALFEDLVYFSSQSASYFIANVQTRRYRLQKSSDMIKSSLGWGWPLIIHLNKSSFRNEIDFGEHDVQDISIRGSLAIPLWNSDSRKWEICRPD